VRQSLLALHPAAASRDGTRATLDIEITKRAEGCFEGRLTVRSAPPGPDRVLQAASCESIAHAAVLIGALTVDALQTVEVPPPPPRRERPLLRLGLRLTGDLGALPAVSAAPGAIVGVRLRRASLDAGVLGFLPRRARLGADSAQGGVFSLAVGTLRGCYTWLADALALGVCAGAELGVLRGAGDHLRQPRSARGPWSALSADVGPRAW
jgi:hypothetical protein